MWILLSEQQCVCFILQVVIIRKNEGLKMWCAMIFYERVAKIARRRLPVLLLTLVRPMLWISPKAFIVMTPKQLE